MRLLNELRVSTAPVESPGQPSTQVMRAAAAPIVPASELIDREQVTVPLSPVENPSDAVLYQDPADSNKSYYLPRYELVTEEVSGALRYRIELAEEESRWVLTIFLNRYLPPELEHSVGSASEMTHEFQAWFSYEDAQRTERLEFSEVQEQPNGKRLAMRLNSIEQRDAIFNAMTDPARQGTLVVARTIQVAIATQVRKPPTTTPNAKFSVHLQRVGNKVSTIKVVRRWTGLGLLESKQLVERRMPVQILKGQTQARAEACSKDLRNAGSQATVKREGSGRPDITPISDQFSVSLTNFGNSKSKLLIILEKFAGLSPAQGKRILKTRPPVTILKKAKSKTVRLLVRELQKIGVLVKVKRNGRSSPIRRTGESPQAAATVKPELQYLGSSEVNIRGIPFVQHAISVSNAQQIPAELFSPAPDLPPCGQNQNSARTWVDILNQDGKRLYGYCSLRKPESLEKLAFNLKKSAAAPSKLQIALNDRRRRTVIKSNQVNVEQEIETETKYRIATVALEQNVAPQPFVFDTRLHAYIYQILDAPPSSELIRRQLNWNGQFYSYFVDARQRHIVYYLPDEFKVSRREEPPFTPSVSVRINSRDDGSDHADVTFSYLAVPVLDQTRLDSAAATLQSELDNDSPALELQPYPVMDFSYQVRYPAETGTQHADPEVAANVFYQGIQTTLVMPLPDFRACFAAMVGQTAASLHGTVSVNLPDDEVISIPFNAEFTDLAGDLFEYAALEDESGEVSITLINSIESPLKVNDLALRLLRGEGQSTASLTFDQTLPASLASGESLVISATPNDPLPGEQPVTASIDTSDVVVEADDEAILESIIDWSATEYYRLVRVTAFPVTFEAVEGREDEQILSVLVHFEGGETLQFDSETLSGTARIDYSVEDVLLGNTVSSKYRYYYDVARHNGTVERVEGKEGTEEAFFVSVTR